MQEFVSLSEKLAYYDAMVGGLLLKHLYNLGDERQKGIQNQHFSGSHCLKFEKMNILKEKRIAILFSTIFEAKFLSY
jgi:hypothetical protein